MITILKKAFVAGSAIASSAFPTALSLDVVPTPSASVPKESFAGNRRRLTGWGWGWGNNNNNKCDTKGGHDEYFGGCKHQIVPHYTETENNPADPNPLFYRPSGWVTVNAKGKDHGSQKICYNLDRLDKQCEDGAYDPNADNSCGVHIHAGTSCGDNAGGHHWNAGDSGVSEDPWGTVRYSTNSNGDTSYQCTDHVKTCYTPDDIDGRIVVFHDYAGKRIACVPICQHCSYWNKKYLKAEFKDDPDADDLGHITFKKRWNDTTNIKVHLKNLHTGDGANGWHVHEFGGGETCEPVITGGHYKSDDYNVQTQTWAAILAAGVDDSQTCPIILNSSPSTKECPRPNDFDKEWGSLPAFIEKGDLAGKFGPLATSPLGSGPAPGTARFPWWGRNDPSLYYSELVGRSIVIHKNLGGNPRRACANIGFPCEHTAQCYIVKNWYNAVGPLPDVGTIKFKETDSSPVVIKLDLELHGSAGLTSGAEAKYHVHQYYDEDPGQTGGHFNPTANAVPCESANPGSTCEYGDLSGKYGKLEVNNPGERIRKQYNDNQLTLSGENGIGGKSIVIHDPDTGAKLIVGAIEAFPECDLDDP